MEPSDTNAQMVTWIVALLGALIGGGLSAFGAWLAIGRQFILQNNNADSLARSFFSFLLEEQIRSVNSMIEYRSSNAGEIAYFDLDKLQTNYALFERNKEWLVRISDGVVRQNIVDVLSGLQIWTNLLRNQAQTVSDTQSKLVLAEAGSPNHQTYLNEVENAKGQVDGLFANLSAARQQLETTKSSL